MILPFARKKLLNWLIIPWALFTLLLSCNSQKEALPMAHHHIQGKNVQLEFQVNHSRLVIQGEQLHADETFSNLTIKKKASIQVENLGTIACDTIAIAKQGKKLYCEGNVSAQFHIKER